jgi:hypothetical protein
MIAILENKTITIQPLSNGEKALYLATLTAIMRDAALLLAVMEKANSISVKG